MRVRAVLLCVLLVAIIWHPASAAAALQPFDVETPQGMRRAQLFRGVEAPTALVVLLHGAGSDPEQMRALTGLGFEQQAREAKWLVAYAEGVGRTWNDCRRTPQSPARLANIDDVGFLAELIRTLRARYRISPERVLLGGFSNGGHMALRVALERPDIVGGVLAIGAQLPSAAESLCAESARAVNTLLIAGTADPIAPYAGGASRALDGQPLGIVDSVPSTAARFAARAGHHEPASRALIGNRDGDPNTYVESRRWQSVDAPIVELLTIHGGGHTIPQSSTRFPTPFGATSADVDTATIARQFMRDWPLPTTPAWQVLAGFQRAKTAECLAKRRSAATAACQRRPTSNAPDPAALVARH